MTTIKIFRKNGKIVKYKATGHVGHAPHGEDVICAAVSAILQFPIAGIDEVLDIYPRLELSDDALVYVDFNGVDLKGKDSDVNTLLESMYVMIRSLALQYPQYLKLVEKEEK